MKTKEEKLQEVKALLALTTDEYDKIILKWLQVYTVLGAVNKWRYGFDPYFNH